MDLNKTIQRKYPNLIVHFGDRTFEYNRKQTEPLRVSGTTIQAEDMIFAEQVHQEHIHIISCKDKGAGISKSPIPSTDALICNLPGLYPAVVTADCVPVLLYDPVKLIVAAVHSGREGTKKAIVKKTIYLMQNHFSSVVDNLACFIGPAICAQHYPVDRDTFENFVSATDSEQVFPYIDLRSTIKQQLYSCGVIDKHIYTEESCTYHDRHFFSYRRDRTKRRQISLIGILKK